VNTKVGVWGGIKEVIGISEMREGGGGVVFVALPWTSLRLLSEERDKIQININHHVNGS
jgi:hypothetical protein